MRSFAFLPLLSIASALTLVAESDSDEVKGLKPSSIHEGAGINYFLLGTNGEELKLDGTDLALATDTGSIPYQVNVDNDIVVAGVLGAAKADVSSGYLSLDGSDSFFGCKNINDPYNYSEKSYVVTTKEIGDCHPLKLKVEGGEESASAAPSSAAPSAPYGNTTTTDITVTDYTTYCPISTTITITTCSEHKCAPHTITVDEPKTITVTGECVVPSSTTTAPVAPTTVESKTTSAPTTVAEESTAPEVSTFVNGANKQMAGLTGLAIVGALLL